MRIASPIKTIAKSILILFLCACSLKGEQIPYDFTGILEEYIEASDRAVAGDGKATDLVSEKKEQIIHHLIIDPEKIPELLDFVDKHKKTEFSRVVESLLGEFLLASKMNERQDEKKQETKDLYKAGFRGKLIPESMYMPGISLFKLPGTSDCDVMMCTVPELPDKDGPFRLSMIEKQVQEDITAHFRKIFPGTAEIYDGLPAGHGIYPSTIPMFLQINDSLRIFQLGKMRIPVTFRKGTWQSDSWLIKATENEVEMWDGVRFIFRNGLLVNRLDRNRNSTRFVYDDNGRLSTIIYPGGFWHEYRWKAGLLDQIADQDGIILKRFEYSDKGFLENIEYGDGSSIKLKWQDAMLVSLTDRDKEKTFFEYDNDGKLSRFHDLYGEVKTRNYSKHDNKTVVREVSELGLERAMYYGPGGHLERYDDWIGGVWRFGRDSNGQISYIRFPDGESFRFLYDGFNNLQAIGSPDGHVRKFDYGRSYRIIDSDMSLPDIKKRGWLISCFDEKSDRTDYYYDTSGNLVRIRTDNSMIREWSYSKGLPVTRTDSTGYVQMHYNDHFLPDSTVTDTGKFSIDYDSRWRFAGIKHAMGYELSVTRNRMGRISAVKTENGMQEQYKYSSGGKLVEYSCMAEQGTIFTYDDAGHLSAVNGLLGSFRIDRDALGRTMRIYKSDRNILRFGYSNSGRLESITDPSGLVWDLTWTPGGKLKKYRDPEGRMGWVDYNSSGRPTELIQNGSVVLNLDYNANGMITMLRSGGLILNLFRDRLGRIVSVRNGKNSEWTYDYGNKGRLSLIRDPSGNETNYRTNNLGLVTEISMNKELKASLAYDAHARLNSVDSVSGRNITITHDSQDRVTGIKFGKLKRDYTYTDSGKLAARTFPGGVDQRFSYNGIDKLAELKSGSGIHKYGYDSMRRLESIRAINDHARIKRDGSGRIMAVLEPLRGNSIYRKFDRSGLVTEFRNGLSYQEYHRDPNGKVYRIERNGIAIDIEKDSSGRTRKISYPNGIVKLVSYDLAGNVSDERIRKDDKTIYSIAYEYDPCKRLLSVSEDYEGLSLLTAYEYNRHGNVINTWYGDGSVEKFSYDKDELLTLISEKRRNETVFNLNNCGQLVKSGSRLSTDEIEYRYDSRGNRTSSGRTVKYEYDADNRLARVEISNASIELEYDTLGRLASRKYTKDGRTKLTRYVWCFDHLFEKISGLSESKFICGEEPGEYYGIIRNDGKILFLVQDWQNSARLVFDENGELLLIRRYKQFGRENKSISDDQCDIGYLGMLNDSDSGIYYTGSNWYDPTTARMLSPNAEIEKNLLSLEPDLRINLFDWYGLSREKRKSKHTEMHCFAGTPALPKLEPELNLALSVTGLSTLLSETYLYDRNRDEDLPVSSFTSCFATYKPGMLEDRFCKRTGYDPEIFNVNGFSVEDNILEFIPAGLQDLVRKALELDQNSPAAWFRQAGTNKNRQEEKW